MTGKEYEEMAKGSYERFMKEKIPPGDRPIYTGPLADNPMDFEHPVLRWDDYSYHKGCHNRHDNWVEKPLRFKIRNRKMEVAQNDSERV